MLISVNYMSGTSYSIFVSIFSVESAYTKL